MLSLIRLTALRAENEVVGAAVICLARSDRLEYLDFKRLKTDWLFAYINPPAESP